MLSDPSSLTQYPSSLQRLPTTGTAFRSRPQAAAGGQGPVVLRWAVVQGGGVDSNPKGEAVTSTDGMRMIDADGHVLEQLQLPQEILDAFMARIVGEVPPADEDPAPDGGVSCRADEPAGRYPTGSPPRGHGRRRHRHRRAVPDVAGPDVGARARTCTTPWLRSTTAGSTSTAPGDPARLFGVGLVALQDTGLAVKEMERCVQDLGFKAVMIRPAPYIGNKKLNDPVYDPFWDAAAQLGCPVGVHPYSFHDMPWNVVSRLGLQEDAFGNPEKGLALRQGLGNALDVMVAMGWFVAGGICERFPKLTVVFLEGSGWLVRADAGAVRSPSGRVRQPLPDNAAVGSLQTAVLHQLRS